jgi:hypothetical protein
MADQMLPLLQSMEKTMASMSQLLQASLAQKPTYKQDVQHNTHLEVPPQQQWHPMDPEKRKNDVDPIHSGWLRLSSQYGVRIRSVCDAGIKGT